MHDMNQTEAAMFVVSDIVSKITLHSMSIEDTFCAHDIYLEMYC